MRTPAANRDAASATLRDHVAIQGSKFNDLVVSYRRTAGSNAA